MLYQCEYQSVLGNIILLSNGEQLTGLNFETGRMFRDWNLDQIPVQEELAIFRLTKQWLSDYFAGKNPTIEQIPMKYSGSEFCMQVWNLLLEIPYGETVTYGELAKKIAKQRNLDKMSAQAIGYAVGHNPISILIPCHRVVGANGNLTGYGGGLDKKIALLRLEGVDMEPFILKETKK